MQVTGLVLADSKGGVVMCPPFPDGGVGTVSADIPTPACAKPVTVSGVDLGRLAQSQHNRTHSWGQTHIEATWNGSTLVVVSQRLPVDADRDLTGRLPDGVPCPAPAGGWKVGGVQDDPGVQKIREAVGAGFGALAMGYPHGGPTNTDGTNPSYGLQNTEQVVVIGVTGDLGRATAAIRKVFTDNLCVVRSTTTAAEIDRQGAQLLATFDNRFPEFGVISTSGRQDPLGTPSNQIDLVVDTPEIHRMVTGIPGPSIVINTWIKPLP